MDYKLYIETALDPDDIANDSGLVATGETRVTCCDYHGRYASAL